MDVQTPAINHEEIPEMRMKKVSRKKGKKGINTQRPIGVAFCMIYSWSGHLPVISGGVSRSTPPLSNPLHQQQQQNLSQKP
jgi:hypothetical protein